MRRAADRTTATFSANRGGVSRRTWARRGGFLVIFSVLAVISNKTSSNSLQPFFLAANSSYQPQQRSVAISAQDEAKYFLRHHQQEQQQEQQFQQLQSKDPGKYPPIQCHELIQRSLLGSEPRKGCNKEGCSKNVDKAFEDPNKGVLHGKQVELDPKFWISLHHQQFDPTRWGIMEHGFYYEQALSGAFKQVLREPRKSGNKEPLRVLDVGGNVGFFTLLSASLGPSVVADVWEPNVKNRLRMCESLALNHWDSEYDNRTTTAMEDAHSQVNLYPNGVGRKEGTFYFTEHTNPGQGTVSEQALLAIDPAAVEKGFVDESKALEVITLDNFARERGWLDESESQPRPDIAILKVDVEGFEYSVIEGATELLKAKIVRNIFMEVSARSPEEIELNKPPILILESIGYKVHKVGGWYGPNVDFEPIPEGVDLADHIMKVTQKETAKQLNLWWILP